MSDQITIENARIASARLYLCDHGVWTSTLTLEGEGWAQGYDGFRMQEGPWMGMWVRGVCAMLGVDDWSKVEGSLVRLKRFGQWGGTRIVALGHILDDRWFDFDAIMKEHK
jgi:hypothetical protein